MNINRLICIVFGWLFGVSVGCSQGQIKIKQSDQSGDRLLQKELTALSTWQAGETVSEAAVAA